MMIKKKIVFILKAFQVYGKLPFPGYFWSICQSANALCLAAGDQDIQFRLIPVV